MARLGLVVGLLVVTACADLEELELDVCGNGVLEPARGEDCDSYATEPGATCARKDEQHECRYVCSEPGTANGCPERWRCGTDGVCRRPAGALGVPEALAQPSGQWLALSDMDGDVQADLVVVDTDRATVAYLEDGQPRQTFEIPLQGIGLPIIAEATNDALQDLLVPTSDGLATLRGSTTRELVPTSYASIPIQSSVEEVGIFPIDLLPDLLLVGPPPITFVGNEYLVLTNTGIIGFGENWSALLSGPLDLTQLAMPAVGDFDELDGSSLLPAGSKTPEEFVLATRGASVVTVYRPLLEPAVLGVNVKLDAKPPSAISIGTAKVGGRMFAVHLNPPSDSSGDSALPCPATPSGRAPGDDHLDLLIDVTEPAGTVAAFGLGDGSFHSSACGLGIDPPDNAAAELEWLNCGALLAVAHLDGDAMVDVATAQGLWLSDLLPDPTTYSCNPMAQPPVSTLGQSWMDARLGDFDGNGLVDLVASDAQGRLDLLLTATDDPPTITTVPTVARATQLAVADFDGDHADDVAYVETFGSVSDDALSVLFGAPGGVPSAPRAITAAPEIVALAPYDQRRFGHAFPDAASELLVVTRDEQSQMRAAILWGRSDRQIYAPLMLVFTSPTQQQEVFLPLATAAGRIELDADPATSERGLFALGAALTGGVVLGGGVIVGENQIDMIDGRVDVDLTGAETGAAALAIDLGADGYDDPVMMSWWQPLLDGDTDAPRATLAYTPVPGQTWQLPAPLQLPGIVPLGARRDLLFKAEDRLGDWSQQLTPKFQRCAIGEGLSAAAFVAIETVSCSSDQVGSTTALYVLDAGLLGSIAAGGASPDGVHVVRAPEGETLLAFACMQADVDAAEEIVLLTLAPGLPVCADQAVADPTAQIYLTDIEAEGVSPLRLLASIDAQVAPELAGDASIRPPLSGMAAGDADGDGVDDVVVATASRMFLLRGQPVNP